MKKTNIYKNLNREMMLASGFSLLPADHKLFTQNYTYVYGDVWESGTPYKYQCRTHLFTGSNGCFVVELFKLSTELKQQYALELLSLHSGDLFKAMPGEKVYRVIAYLKATRRWDAFLEKHSITPYHLQAAKLPV
jgi:hypothetical protein